MSGETEEPAPQVLERLTRGADDMGHDPRRVRVAYGDDLVILALADGATASDVVAGLMLAAPDFVLDGAAVLVFRRAES